MFRRLRRGPCSGTKRHGRHPFSFRRRPGRRPVASSGQGVHARTAGSGRPAHRRLVSRRPDVRGRGRALEVRPGRARTPVQSEIHRPDAHRRGGRRSHPLGRGCAHPACRRRGAVRPRRGRRRSRRPRGLRGMVGGRAGRRRLRSPEAGLGRGAGSPLHGSPAGPRVDPQPRQRPRLREPRRPSGRSAALPRQYLGRGLAGLDRERRGRPRPDRRRRACEA